jgi:translin
MSLKTLIDMIQEDLKKREEIRKELQMDKRNAIRLSKQVILYVHQERFEDAKKCLEDGKDVFKKLYESSKNQPNLVYSGLFDAALEEYSEANIFLTLVEEGRFINPKEINVPFIPFVLGLGDVVGELRRRALDSLRKGKIEEAEDCLEKMEHIYLELTAMDDAYLLVSGLRRKCDIARRIIETTRGDITIEVRRRSLENAIKGLQRTLERHEN